MPPPQLEKYTWDRYGMKTHVGAVIVWGSDEVSRKNSRSCRPFRPKWRCNQRWKCFENCRLNRKAAAQNGCLVIWCQHVNSAFPTSCAASYFECESITFRFTVFLRSADNFSVRRQFKEFADVCLKQIRVWEKKIKKSFRVSFAHQKQKFRKFQSWENFLRKPFSVSLSPKWEPSVVIALSERKAEAWKATWYR